MTKIDIYQVLIYKYVNHESDENMLSELKFDDFKDTSS